MRKLPDKYWAFIEYLFDDEVKGNVPLAKEKAGIDNEVDGDWLVQELADEINKRAEYEIILQAPKAVKRLEDIMDNPNQVGAQLALKASEMILDRSGIIKKDKLLTEGVAMNAILLLPPKQTETKEDN